MRRHLIYVLYSVLYSTLLHLPPLRFQCVGRCWVLRWVSDAKTARLDLIHSLGQISSTYSARSHPHTRLDLIQYSAVSHPHTRLDLIQYSAVSHPHSARSHPPPLGQISSTHHSARSHPPLSQVSSTTRLDLIHRTAKSHPPLGQISSTHGYWLYLIHILGQISSTTRQGLIHILGQISSTTRLDLIHHSARSHPHTRLDLIHHSARSPSIGWIYLQHTHVCAQTMAALVGRNVYAREQLPVLPINFS